MRVTFEKAAIKHIILLHHLHTYLVLLRENVESNEF